MISKRKILIGKEVNNENKFIKQKKKIHNILIFFMVPILFNNEPSLLKNRCCDIT